MMHNGHAPDLIRTQKDSRFLLGLAERGLKNILSSLDVPARRAQKTSRIGGIRRPPQHQHTSGTLQQHVGVNQGASPFRRL